MEKKTRQVKYGRIFILILLTLFFVSFSVSALIIINSNKLVFVSDMEEYEAITGGLKDNEDKDQKIIDLTEQVERYKSMYESLSDENKSLVKTNQNLNSKVSSLESQLKNASSKPKDEVKPSDDKDEKDDNKDTDKKEEETKETSKTTSNKNTSSKTTSNKNTKPKTDE